MKKILCGFLIVFTLFAIEAVPETRETPSGLVITIIKKGHGDIPAGYGDKIRVHYVGKLTNGKKFDSSRDRKKPFAFQLGAGQVIKGWEQGIKGMVVGEKRRLKVPASLGYGSRGTGSIPANSTLIFEVELISID